MVQQLTHRWRLAAIAAVALWLLPTQALLQDATIVTDLRIMHGATEAAAREACAALCPCRDALTKHVVTNWVPVGVNLNLHADSDSDSSFTLLCMRQDRRTAVERDGATLFVLQSIALVDREKSCPPSMTTLFRPRAGVSVCLQPVSATHALATGTYVSDVDVVVVAASSSGSNASKAMGWVTDPISMHTTSAANTINAPSVHLQYKRPVRPIVDVRVLSNVDPKTGGAMACWKRLDIAWEPAGMGFIHDPANDSKRIVLCVKRMYVPGDGDVSVEQTEASRVLTRVKITPSTASCGSNYSEQALFSADWYLCLNYEGGASAHFIHQMQLVTTSSDTTAQSALPGWVVDASSTDFNKGQDGFSTYVMTQEGASTGDPTQIRQLAQPTAPAAKTPPLSAKPPLRARVVDSNDTAPRLTFKILQIADLHLTGDPDRYCLNPPLDRSMCGMQCTESLSVAFLNDLLDAEAPDLVMFSGDTITVREWGLKDSALEAALAPVEQRNIPYAWIMGNHDDDYVYGREEIMGKLVQRPLAYVESGPTTIQGVGNYELNIKSPGDADGSSRSWGSTNNTVFRVYFLDSNKKRNETLFPNIRSTYDWIREEQIDFYRELSDGHRNEAADNSTVPAVMFFHIPIPEYGSMGSVFSRHGAKNEKTEGPGYNSHLLATLSELQEVKATFVGHDHTNEFCYKKDGVQLCYGGGTGFGAALGNSHVARRARVIEWSMGLDGRREIRSWKRHFGRDFPTRQLEEVLYRDAT